MSWYIMWPAGVVGLGDVAAEVGGEVEVVTV